MCIDVLFVVDKIDIELTLCGSFYTILIIIYITIYLSNSKHAPIYINRLLHTAVSGVW